VNIKLESLMRIPAILTVAVGGPMLVSTAFAVEPGFYAGGGFGYANIVTDDDKKDLRNAIATAGLTGTVDDDTKNFGWKLFGGYNLSEFFGVELAYVGLGEIEFQVDITAPAASSTKVTSEIGGWEYVLTGYYPLSQDWDLTGRIGGISWDADTKVSTTVPDIDTDAFSDSDGTSFTVGIGLNRMISERLSWHMGVQYFDVDRDLFLFNSGLSYHFGY